MLSSTLMKQQLRCLKHLRSPRSFVKPSSTSSLVPTKYLATTAIQKSGTDHGKLWAAERAVSGAQIPALIVPFIWTTPMTDAIFCTLAVLHSHWGKFF